LHIQNRAKPVNLPVFGGICSIFLQRLNRPTFHNSGTVIYPKDFDSFPEHQKPQKVGHIPYLRNRSNGLARNFK